MIETCASCGGKIKLIKGPGRFKMYRGVMCEYPASLGIRTCMKCDAEWVCHTEISVISESFEKQRLTASK